jgi:hypothetical protein
MITAGVGETVCFELRQGGAIEQWMKMNYTSIFECNKHME